MKTFKGTILFFTFLLVLVVPCHGDDDNDKSTNKENNSIIKEQTLGSFKLGESLDETKKKLEYVGELYNQRMIFKDNWTAWIDLKNNTLIGISYDPKIGNKDTYPKTSQLITIGSKLAEVEKAYGVSGQTLSGKSPFFLQDSELLLISVYPLRGVWIGYTNKTPYSGSYDWRVSNIVVGNSKIIEHMRIGTPAYATSRLTSEKKNHIINSYEEKYGSMDDLKIFDNFMYDYQLAVFDYVKSIGDYTITPFFIVPRGKEKAIKFSEDFLADGPLSKKLKQQVKNKMLLKYNISMSQLEQILENAKLFKDDLFAEEVSKRHEEDAKRFKEGLR